ncbi:MAG TPA: autotransporter domain-containing protein, partial [Luteolibacter sp.]|nr:autotransporter domain-containing protein [Luteolibacter sp.]
TVRGSAMGIRAGDGANEIINEGTLRVVATANATATSEVGAGWAGDAFETGNAAAVATAIGIEAGDGGNVIVNSGLIDVSADASASGTTFRTVVESAIAIRTGSGNDTIVNEGTGEIVIRKNGGISGGTVVDAGAGDDIVRLLGSSLVRGDIVLGEGNDLIAFGGNGGFTGSVFGDAGIDTISIEDRRVLDFEPDAFRSIERLAVNQGTLRISEDYTIVDSGGLRVELFDGGYGRLEIDGSAVISGDTGLEVIAAPRIYRDGETFDVMVGESLTGTFGSATLPSSLMIQSSLNYLPDTLQLELAVAPFRTFGRNPGQQAIGGYLDSIAPIVSGDLAATLGEWQFISDTGELTDVFESLNPGIYNSMTRATLDAGRDLNRLLGRRMRSVLPWEGSGIPSRVKLPAGFSSSKSPVAAAPDPVAPAGARTGAWMTGFHHWGSQDGQDGYTGYDQRSSGFSLGYDTLVNEHFLLGGALTYADSNIDLDDGMGDGDIEAMSASLYGGWFTDRWWINGSASYGRQDYDVHRTTSPAIPGGIAESSYDGNLFSAALGGGIIFRLSENWRIEPFAGLEYLYLDEDGIRETGAGPTSLLTDGRSTDALYSELGIQLAGEIDCGNFTTLPFLGAAWVHDFGIDDKAFNAGFTGAPGTSFTMPGFDSGTDRLRIEAGVGFAVDDGLIQFGYMGEFGSGYDSHGLRASVGFSF